jgi:hypothetical protein
MSMSCDSRAPSSRGHATERARVPVDEIFGNGRCGITVLLLGILLLQLRDHQGRDRRLTPLLWSAYGVRTGFDERMPDVGKFVNICLRRRIAS